MARPARPGDASFGRIRFDVAAVTVGSHGAPEIEVREDVF
jgi:hypothetical protein